MDHGERRGSGSGIAALHDFLGIGLVAFHLGFFRFLDGGFGAARRVVKQIFAGRTTTGPAKGPKSRLQEWSQATHHVMPSYTLVGMTGPAHAASFVAEVTILEIVQVLGEGNSKKDAEKAARRERIESVLEEEDAG